MSDNLSLDPKTTAVVLIEYQNDFTSDGGALHGAVADVMDSTGMLDNTVQLVAAARAAGATIMHAPITSLVATTRSPPTRTGFSRASLTATPS